MWYHVSRSSHDWRKAGMGDDDDGHKAFRLCIHAEDTHRLMNPEAWPNSVMISEWYFNQPRNVAVEDQSNRRHMTGNNGCDLECWWSQSRWPWTTSTCSVSDRWFADQICGVNWCYSSRGGWRWTTMMTRYWSNSWITRTMTTMATNSDSGDFMTTTTVTDDDTLLYQDAATTVH